MEENKQEEKAEIKQEIKETKAEIRVAEKDGDNKKAEELKDVLARLERDYQAMEERVTGLETTLKGVRDNVAKSEAESKLKIDSSEQVKKEKKDSSWW